LRGTKCECRNPAKTAHTETPSGIAAENGAFPTKNGQTVDNQRKALTEAISRRSGWIIADEFADKGITGAKGRDKRPEFDRLLREVVWGKIDVVAAWSVDRLGRSLQDLVGFLGELNSVGCDLYLGKASGRHNHPSRTGALPDARRICRVRARDPPGAHPRWPCQGASEGHQERQTNRPAKIDATREAAIRAALASGKGILKTARECGTGVSVVQRIKADMARDK
jgi:DNA invertase Pin-like site-specific DNA recombinase